MQSLCCHACPCNEYTSLVPWGHPRNITSVAVSDTSVQLKWRPPPKEQCNGKIVQYEINYNKRYDSINTETRNTSTTELMLDDLETNTEYVALIKAYTSKGAGIWSPKYTFKTYSRRKYSLSARFSVVVRLLPQVMANTWLVVTDANACFDWSGLIT